MPTNSGPSQLIVTEKVAQQANKQRAKENLEKKRLEEEEQRQHESTLSSLPNRNNESKKSGFFSGFAGSRTGENSNEVRNSKDNANSVNAWF